MEQQQNSGANKTALPLTPRPGMAASSSSRVEGANRGTVLLFVLLFAAFRLYKPYEQSVLLFSQFV